MSETTPVRKPMYRIYGKTLDKYKNIVSETLLFESQYEDKAFEYVEKNDNVNFKVLEFKVHYLLIEA